MKYFLPLFLTLPIVSVGLFAKPDLRKLVQRLDSPVARERQRASKVIESYKGDIGPAVRGAWASADQDHRMQMLDTMRRRGDDALLAHAMDSAVGDFDLTEHVVSYLLALPQKSIDDLEAKESWESLLQARADRRVVRTLLYATFQPGRYDGQFDAVRTLDHTRLRTSFHRLLNFGQGFGHCLQQESNWIAATYAPDVSTSRTRSWGWFETSASRVELAWDVYRRLWNDQKLSTKQLGWIGGRMAAYAVSLVHQLRITAVRAFSEIVGEPCISELLALHRDASNRPNDSWVDDVVDQQDFLRELETALARLGRLDLLVSRISSLRSKVEQINDATININARPAARVDLMARFESATLATQARMLEQAELEWTSLLRDLVRQRVQMTRTAKSAATSFMGALYYNLACVQSMRLKTSSALVNLKRAVSHGYKDYHWMVRDGDLGALRGTTGFRDWFDQVAPPSAVALRIQRDD